MMSLREKETHYTEKQEANEPTKAASSSSKQWSGLKNPRIVRVSRTFGGKDRHSKVCTIKGLRDRRIRLSVPTAIQLYDLQDRLGLNQPSKVIDWLLDTTKHDIDKLPPLPIVPGSFTPFHQPTTNTCQEYGDPQSCSNSILDANLLSFRKEGININSEDIDVNEDDQSLVAKLKYWDSNVVMRSKQKGVDNHHGAMEEGNTSQVSAQNFFPLASGSSSVLPHSTLLDNNNMFNYYQWEPSNLSLTQLGNHDLPSQNDNHQSSLSLSSGSQLCLYPSMATTPLLHPHASFMNTHHHQEDNELRQFNRFDQFSNPISSSLHNSTTLGSKPFPWSMNHQSHWHQNDDITRHLDKDEHGS